MEKVKSKKRKASENDVLNPAPIADMPAVSEISDVPVQVSLPQGDKYINPLTDFGFKRLFGEKNKELMIDFLNSVLDLNDKIVSLEYKNAEQTGQIKKERGAFFDLHCLTKKKEYIIVEMQYMPQRYFMDRVLYYATFPIRKQAKKGKWNFNLNPVYFVCLLDFTIEKKEKQQYLYYVQLMDRDSLKVFYKKLLFLFLELPDFLKKEEDLKTAADQWLYAIKHLNELRNVPACYQESRIFRQLFEEAAIANLTPEELELYEESQKKYKNMYTVRDIVKDYERANVTLTNKVTRLTGKVSALSDEVMELRRLLQQSGIDIPNIEKRKNKRAQKN